MTIRVTASTDGTTTTVLVEGHLTSADLADVQAACDSANKPVRLDLTGLQSADTDGIRALRSLSEAGRELHGANPYVRRLLSEAGE